MDVHWGGKIKHYQRRGGKRSENTFSVTFWKVNETTKYGKVVPDGKNILEEFHLITFVQDVLIWMTYINCILKLTALPTAANGKLPGAGKGLSAFSSSASTAWMGLRAFLLFSWGKISMVPLDTARKCPLRAALGPPGFSVIGPVSCPKTTPMHQRGGMARSQCLGKNLVG